jgi:YbbR domain-containing protein
MVKEHIKKAFSSRVFYMVFSLLASVAVWLYVSYIENPDITVTVRNVKLELLNEDYLADKGLIITKINTDTVTLRFTGKRNIVTRLTDSNVTASVNLTEIKEKGVKYLGYTINYPIDINPSSFVTAKSVDYITIAVDNLVSKEIPVKGSYDGGVAEGYQAEPMELTPSVITVSGPEEVLSEISYAWVPVLRENLSKTVDEKLLFTLMDISGHEVKSDKLSLNQDTVNVVIPVFKIKEIPLTVNLIFGAGSDLTNTDVKISPPVISVSGEAETLDEINQIPLGTGAVDTTKFLNAKTFEFPIVLPNGTKNLAGINEATVTVTINGLESIHVTTENIDVTNETPGYSAEVITKSLDLLIRGPAADIEKITPDENGNTKIPVSYRVVADLSELGNTVGTYSVLAKVYVDGDVDVGAVGEYKVTVVITKD